VLAKNRDQHHDYVSRETEFQWTVPQKLAKESGAASAPKGKSGKARSCSLIVRVRMDNGKGNTKTNTNFQFNFIQPSEYLPQSQG
jgi:hypothetical protein